MQKKFSFLVLFVSFAVAAVLCLAASLPLASPSLPAAGAEEPKTFGSEEELAGYIRENILLAGELPFLETPFATSFAQAAAVPDAAAGQAERP